MITTWCGHYAIISCCHFRFYVKWYCIVHAKLSLSSVLCTSLQDGICKLNIKRLISDVRTFVTQLSTDLVNDTQQQMQVENLDLQNAKHPPYGSFQVTAANHIGSDV